MVHIRLAHTHSHTIWKESKISVVDDSVIRFVVVVKGTLPGSDIGGLTDVNTCVVEKMLTNDEDTVSNKILKIIYWYTRTFVSLVTDYSITCTILYLLHQDLLVR